MACTHFECGREVFTMDPMRSFQAILAAQEYAENSERWTIGEGVKTTASMFIESYVQGHYKTLAPYINTAVLTSLSAIEAGANAFFDTGSKIKITCLFIGGRLRSPPLTHGGEQLTPLPDTC